MRPLISLALLFTFSLVSAHAGWPVEFQAGMFRVHADYQPHSLNASDLSTGLANLPTEIESALGIKISPGEVHLILFQRDRSYREYMRKHFPDVVPRQAMFIRRGGPGMVFAYDSPQLAVDLRHESTHALLNASLPYVPLWMDEGLAEYFEANAQERLNGHSHMTSVKLRSRFTRPPEVQSLESIDSLAKMDADAYRNAWSIIHFLLHESDASRNVLQNFMRDLQAHAPPGQFSRRLDSELPDWRTRYSRHFR